MSLNPRQVMCFVVWMRPELLTQSQERDLMSNPRLQMGMSSGLTGGRREVW